MMKWLAMKAQEIDTYGQPCRVRLTGRTALGWIMPDGIVIVATKDGMR